MKLRNWMCLHSIKYMIFTWNDIASHSHFACSSVNNNTQCFLTFINLSNHVNKYMRLEWMTSNRIEQYEIQLFMLNTVMDINLLCTSTSFNKLNIFLWMFSLPWVNEFVITSNCLNFECIQKRFDNDITNRKCSILNI